MKKSTHIFMLLTLIFLGQLAGFGQNALTPKTDPAAAEILEKHVTAIGGREVWVNTRAVETRTRSEAFGNTSQIYRFEDRKSGRFYQRTEGPTGTIELGFDGSRAWRKASFFRGYLPDSDPQAKAALKKRTQLFDFRNSNLVFKKLPNEEISGKSFLVISTTDVDLLDRKIPVKYYFDPSTYLLKRTLMGSEVTQTTTFDDYQVVQGRTIAFQTIVESVQATIKNSIISVAYDVPIDEARFSFEGKSESGPSAVTTSISSPGAPNDEVLSAAIRNDTFELIWRTINDSYWDKSFGGIDWAALREKYGPKVLAASSSLEFHKLMGRMVGELHRSHFNITPPEHSVGLHTIKAELKNGSLGIDIRFVQSKIVVTRVDQDSSARTAGIREGFIIVGIDGKGVDKLYDERIQKSAFQMRPEFERVRAVSIALNGPPGTKVELELLDTKDRVMKIALERLPRNLERSLEFDHKRINTKVGYIRFNFFVGDVVSKFAKAISDLKDSKTLILDLRGNPGGVGQIAPSIASMLCKEDGSLGTFFFRYDSKELNYNGSQRAAYRGQIMILLDETSASTTEVLAAALQEQKRAIVIGNRSAGAVLPSTVQILPTGGVLQYVIANYKTPRGTILEGKGVLPDITVERSRVAIAEGVDEFLQAALKTI